MDKNKEIDSLNHGIQIMGHILIKGENLELIKLDTFQGTLSIKGRLNSLNYLESKNGKTPFKESVISKLFKWWV